MSDGAPGARCAEHFDLPSEAPCSRCGRFCCQSCLLEQDPPLCPACAATVLDPYQLRSRGFELVHTLKASAQLIAAELPRLAVLVLAFSVPVALLQTLLVPTGNDLQSIGSSVRLENIYDALVGLVGSQAMLALFIARSEGRALDLAGALREGAGNFGRAFGARFRSGLSILGFLLLLVLPGLWKATLLMFSSIAALRTQDRDALDASQVLVRGRFWPCFGFGLLASGLAFGPMFILLAVISGLSEWLGAPRFVEELATDVVARFFADVVMTSLLYVAFVLLHRDAGEVLGKMDWKKTPPLAQRGAATLQGS